MSYSKITIEGNLGNDPGLKMTPKGTPVCRFSVCTNDYVGKDKDGKTKTKANWHNVVLFGPRAESAAKHLKKGRRVLLDGRMDYYETGEGENKRHHSQIIIDNLIYLDRKPEEKGAPEAEPPASPADAPFDDDIPF